MGFFGEVGFRVFVEMGEEGGAAAAVGGAKGPAVVSMGWRR